LSQCKRVCWPAAPSSRDWGRAQSTACVQMDTARRTPAWAQASGVYFKGDHSPQSALLGYRCFMGLEGSLFSKGAQDALAPAAIHILLLHPLRRCSQHRRCRRPSPALSATGPATAEQLHLQQPGDLLAALLVPCAPGKEDAGALVGFTGTSTVLVLGDDSILPGRCIPHLHALHQPGCLGRPRLCLPIAPCLDLIARVIRKMRRA